ADVLEHVGDPAAAIAEAARILRPGGHLFVNTIARTLRARLFAIALGEGLGFLPRGTHRHDRFVRPDELDRMAAASELVRQRRTGERPALLATLRRRAVVLARTRSLAVGYAVLYRKRER
ncbi:MAG: methyltransferase domain-containing protein, partial [Planctomycetota bacterium]